MPGYKLIYFDGRGRVEPTRILFAAAGIPFTDERLSQDDFKKIKERNPTQSLPILEISEGKKGGEPFVLNQSMTINRHLSGTFGLDGQDRKERAIVDETIENIVELKSAMFSFMFNQSEENSTKLDNALDKTCPKLEGLIAGNMKKGNGFAVGSKLSFADVFIYEAFESLLALKPNALDKYKAIQMCRDKVAKMPRIAQYLKARKVTQF